MQLGFTFDATQHDPSQGDGQLPAGVHTVIATSAEAKQSQSNAANAYIQLTLRIADGPHAGSSGPLRFNMRNQNAQAQDIAYRQLSALCHAIGVLQVTDTDQLLNKPFKVEVQHQAKNPEYTEVKKILDVNGNQPKRGGPAPQAAPPAPAPAPQAAAPAQPAWQQQPAAPAPGQAPPPQASAPVWAQQAPAAPAPAPQATPPAPGPAPGAPPPQPAAAGPAWFQPPG